MVFAAFSGPNGAGRAFARLKSEGFEEAGFSVIGAHTQRSQPKSAYPDNPELNELVDKMNLAPTLTVEGTDVASAGALPAILNAGSGASFHGLQNAFRNAGATPGATKALEDILKSDGLIVGVALEGPKAAQTARSICSAEGALETITLEVPDKDERPA